MSKIFANFASDIRKLRQLVFLGQAASLLVFLVGGLAICLFFNPEIVGIPQQQYRYYQGQWLWLCIGIIFSVLAVYWIVVSEKKYYRLVWIFKNTEPESMNLSIEIEDFSDSINYRAILSIDDRSLWKVSLVLPTWRVKSLENRQVLAQIYFDPKTNCPAVIETEFGLLWAGWLTEKI